MRKIQVVVCLFLILAAVYGCRNRASAAGDITPAEIEGHIRFLSDDLLEGRAVGSPGLAVAALYHESVFRSLGLEPAFAGGSYYQPVTLYGSLPDPRAELEFVSRTGTLKPRYLEEFLVNSQRRDAPHGVEGELVYCGYLIQAPERDWDDIQGMDLKGKVLLIEINEPGNFPGGIFDGEDMTYYGRWTYKFEKASELGATGVLIIHETKGAAYDWNVLRNSVSGESLFLPDVVNNLYFQGWIHGNAAQSVLGEAGFDHTELKVRAARQDFTPVPLGISARVRQRPHFRSVESRNVAAVLRAAHRDKKERTIIFSAHYDHFGRDPALEGDQIYNGAVDNCSASASLLALARYFSDHADSLKADLLFVGVTAEEAGLLGSDYFARHLPVDKSTVAANLNLEMTNVWGETEDVYAIGGRHSDLGEICAQAALNLGLDYIAEQNGELGYFYRSDQLSFARTGIPAVWLHEGITSRGAADKNYILRKNREYRSSRYHKVSDEIEEDWDLAGAVQITDWARAIVDILQNMEALPRFKPTSSFRRE